jgi:hypothetical protein
MVEVVVSDEQAYFWTDAWQRDERESLAELEVGRGRTFDSAAEAIAWLTSDDDA